MGLNAIFSVFFLLFLLSGDLSAQGTLPKKQETPAQIKNAATNLEKSLIENNDRKIARDYELLAQGFTDKEELLKAEEYLFKALDVYTAAARPNDRARVLRSIAKVQELQDKLKAAAQNYNAAGMVATDSILKALNANDYARLKDVRDPGKGYQLLDANIQLLKEQGKAGEIADTYVQQALLHLKAQDSITALEKYTMALPYAAKFPGKVINIYEDIATLHSAAKRFDDAIAATRQLLAIAKELNDLDTEILQLRNLSDMYREMGDSENAVASLKESYEIASSNGKTFEAKESLLQLAGVYKESGDFESEIALYEEFLRKLDRIILSDNSLTDAKTFRVTEERIRSLENEKTLKDEIITRKNTFNYFLLGSMVLLLLLFASIVKALYSIKTKNKEIALQSLRREMNPHFLFNSLNSVNQFIAQNNELQANKYLTSYSNLMRNTMENSNKDFVTLGNEIENLTQYLELEHLRFKDKFDYRINVDEKLDRETLWVPNMMLQPHLENAIWHGLRYKDDVGLLRLDFSLQGNDMLVTIDDDGIGPTKSRELKTDNQKVHNSRGLTNTKERMTLLNDLYKTKINFTVSEKLPPQTGTIVQVTFPIINKPK